MPEFLTRTRHEIDRLSWDAFVDAADEAWLWHRYDLQDALVTWGQLDLSFGVYQETTGDLLAVVPLHLRNGRLMRVVPWSTLSSTGGPALKNEPGDKLRGRLVEFIREHLLALARRYNVFEINLACSPMAPAWRGPRCPRVNPLLDFGCQNTLSQTYVVDLRQPEDVMKARYSELTRRELRKIEREDLTIREACGSADLDVYYQLHVETYRRTGAQPHPAAYFRAIFEKFVPHGLSRILFLIRAGEVVAAQNTGLYKGGAIYWTGASRSDKAGGENRLLFHHQMVYAQSAGVEYYETGEAFPGARGGKTKGLNDFKRSFGGELYPFYKGRLVAERRVYTLAAGLRAFRAVE